MRRPAIMRRPGIARRPAMTRIACHAAVLALAIILGGCAANRARPISGRELVELDDAWAAHAARGDIGAVMALWTEDATMYPEGARPLYGKQAIREFFDECLGANAAGARHEKQPGHRLSWTPSCAGVDPHGATAYTVGEYSATMPAEGGLAKTLNGRYLAVWRKEDDAWRCAVKCCNSSPLENRLPSPVQP